MEYEIIEHKPQNYIKIKKADGKIVIVNHSGPRLDDIPTLNMKKIIKYSEKK